MTKSLFTAMGNTLSKEMLFNSNIDIIINFPNRVNILGDGYLHDAKDTLSEGGKVIQREDEVTETTTRFL